MCVSGGGGGGGGGVTYHTACNEYFFQSAISRYSTDSYMQK